METIIQYSTFISKPHVITFPEICLHLKCIPIFPHGDNESQSHLFSKEHGTLKQLVANEEFRFKTDSEFGQHYMMAAFSALPMIYTNFLLIFDE